MNEISRELNNLNIDKVIKDYKSLLNQIPLLLKSDNTLEFLKEIKRDKVNYGPYPNVTLFESANRIMTDLTILLGVKKLLSGEIKELKYNKYIVEFGNDNKNHNDIYAFNKFSTLIGEAFYVAPSFFQIRNIPRLRK